VSPRRPTGFVRGPAAAVPGLVAGHARVTGDRSGPVFHALADPTRRGLLARLGSLGAASATELARELPVTRQAVVKHLAVLAEAGLANPERQGREVRYRLQPEPLSDAMAWMAGVGAAWDERLAALERHLGER
jgi:DNA-binding transcriptional ArsR family regulator